MSFYDAQSWQVPVRPTSWEQPLPPSRSGTNSAMQREDINAFDIQMEEVDRALDNLTKSGKLFAPPSRRESMPMIGGPRPYSDFDPRMSALTQRHHSISDYDPSRAHSGSSLQSYYANQRQQPRANEPDQAMQIKRRMAAQRERELRNYHQEQQYNRSESLRTGTGRATDVGGPVDINTQNKSDRAISPNAMNEDDRRELIARQHRALYGNDGGSFYEGGHYDESHTPRPATQPPAAPTSATSARGPSPLAYNSFGLNQNQAQPASKDAGQFSGLDQSQPAQPAQQPQPSQPSQPSQQSGPTGPSPKLQQQRSRANSTSSPASNPQSFSLFENAAQQSSRTSTSSPGVSPPRPSKSATKAATLPISAGVAPIGTRPASNQAGNPALNKRSTTPLPSPLSYGFAPNESLTTSSAGNERSTSAASNPSAGTKDANMGGMAWGSGSGVWGKNSLGVQASVWG
ncbi:hypothetical protein MMC07_005468 [Pseudocyphellaria aurata]|nr:hypothetical protein [Pseudocyphellaria aurata]